MPRHVVMGLGVLFMERGLDLGSQAVRVGPAAAQVAGDRYAGGAGTTQLRECVCGLMSLQGGLTCLGLPFPCLQ